MGERRNRMSGRSPITEALPAICITTRWREPVVEGLVRAESAVVADHARLYSVAAGLLNDIGDDTRVRSRRARSSERASLDARAMG